MVWWCPGNGARTAQLVYNKPVLNWLHSQTIKISFLNPEEGQGQDHSSTMCFHDEARTFIVGYTTIGN